eukprot:TRINITY_DN3555_c0_g1_i4.p1 TRINITY_DN3555_c0_g1~~TRINITY_DN3555_c0_g1_i4.p1  ORF type:complete len:565 (+),score=124.54 TRINITY_DN3555_c0_g1_i4:106-1695(+)
MGINGFVAKDSMKALLEKRRVPVEASNPVPARTAKPPLKTLSTLPAGAKPRVPLQPIAQLQKATPTRSRVEPKETKEPVKPLRTVSSMSRPYEFKPKPPVPPAPSAANRKITIKNECSTPVAIRQHQAISNLREPFTPSARRSITTKTDENGRPIASIVTEKTPAKPAVNPSTASNPSTEMVPEVPAPSAPALATTLAPASTPAIAPTVAPTIAPAPATVPDPTPAPIPTAIQTLPFQPISLALEGYRSPDFKTAVTKAHENIQHAKVELTTIGLISDAFNSFMSKYAKPSIDCLTFRIGASLNAINEKLNKRDLSLQSLKSKRFETIFYVDFPFSELSAADGRTSFRFSLCPFTNQIRGELSDEVHKDFRTFGFKVNTVLNEEQIWRKDVLLSLFSGSESPNGERQPGIKVTFVVEEEFLPMMGMLDCLLNTESDVRREFDACQFNLILFDRIDELLERERNHLETFNFHEILSELHVRGRRHKVLIISRRRQSAETLVFMSLVKGNFDSNAIVTICTYKLDRGAKAP